MVRVIDMIFVAFSRPQYSKTDFDSLKIESPISMGLLSGKDQIDETSFRKCWIA